MRIKRTNIEIDVEKLERVKKLSGLNTAKDAVDFALNRIAGTRLALDRWCALRGKVRFATGYDYKKGR